MVGLAEAFELAGIDYMTVSPRVLKELQATATMSGGPTCMPSPPPPPPPLPCPLPSGHVLARTLNICLPMLHWD